MKLGGTTDIKFVRPKQTRHLFCLGRFLFLDLYFKRVLEYEFTFIAEQTWIFLLFSFGKFKQEYFCDLRLSGEYIDFQIFCFVISNFPTGRWKKD